MNGYYQNSHKLQSKTYQSTISWWKEKEPCPSDCSQCRPPIHATTSISNVSYPPPPTPIFQKQWCYVDRVGGQYVVINSYDNLPLPEKPSIDCSHYSHSPPNLARYNADRRYQFMDTLPKALEKLHEYTFDQEPFNVSHKWKRQRCA